MLFLDELPEFKRSVLETMRQPLVGKAIILSGTYTEILGRPGLVGRFLAAAEREVVDLNHTEAGAWLLRCRKMPDEIVMPVLYHHDTNWSGDFARTSAVVNLADILAHDLENPSADKKSSLAEAAVAMEVLELGNEKLVALKSLAEIEIKRLAPVMSFQI